MQANVAEKAAPRLFISYSHDSREHQDRVRALADRLRQDGIDALIDQYDIAPPNGWPMWMDREIQKADFVALVCTDTYRKRVEQRELPGRGRGVLWEAKLIYNRLYAEDTDYQRFIPILMEGGAESFIPLPLQGLSHYEVDTAKGYEDFYGHLTYQMRPKMPVLGERKSQPVIEPQSYPASLEVRTHRKAETNLDRRNRLQMLKRVRLDWIDGVLKQSLYKVVRLEIGLETKSEAVEQPWKAIVRTPDHPPEAVPAGTTISQIFEDHASALLVLGAPGTGKTTLLLELARELLDRAEADENSPMPVVFNLSSWAVRREPLSKWLASEMNERSDVPKRLAQEWVDSEQIIPLLDGLDEVVRDQQRACAEAINNFRRDHGLMPIAVCSRIADYEALGTKLRLRNAVVVQPLTQPEVKTYFDRIGEPVRTLRLALERDPSMWELLETPLMLWVAILAYRDAPLEFPLAATAEQRRKRLFARFVDAMFERRFVKHPYSRGQSVAWLSWLAATLKRNAQTVFYLENLHERWLATASQRWLARALTVSGSMLVVGLIYGLSVVLMGRSNVNVMSNGDGMTVGLVYGLIFGLAGTFIELRPIEKMRLSLANMSSRLSRAAHVGLMIGPTFGLVFGWREGLENGLLHGLISGVRYGLLYMVGFGLVTLLFGEAVETRRSPNHGTLRSARMAVTVGLLAGLIVGLIDGFIGGVPVAQKSGFAAGLHFGLCRGVLHGLKIGVIYSLVSGGLFSLKHLVLRLLLVVDGSVPMDYVRFLDHAVGLLFLRKVGGGYIFVHRMLLEYFASLPKQPDLD
jgi:hypothetical protein